LPEPFTDCFKISDHCFFYREIGLCTLDGRHPTLLSYSPDQDLTAWSDGVKTSIAEQTSTIHGLQYSDPSAQDQAFVFNDIFLWYTSHCSSDCPTVGLVDTTPLKELFQAMDIPVFKLEVEDLHDLPIGTINVMTPCDDREWCKKHDHGKLPVWHDNCARVMACKLSW